MAPCRVLPWQCFPWTVSKHRNVLPGMHQQEPPPTQHTAPLQSPCPRWKLRTFSPQLNLRIWHHRNIIKLSILPAPPQAGEVLTQKSWSSAGVGMRGCRAESELHDIGSVPLSPRGPRVPTTPLTLCKSKGGEEPKLSL